MKKIIILSVAAVAAISVSACAANTDRIPQTERVLGKLETRSFEVEPVHRIEVEAVAALHVTQGPEQSVRIATEPDHFAALDIRKEGDTLIIDHVKRHRGKRHVRIDITLARLDGLTIDGVVDGELEGIETGDFSLDFDGVGDLEITGSCRNATLVIDGIGDIDLGRFHCRNVQADVSGIGDVSLFASETLTLDASGIGDVTVQGSPRVRSLSKGGIGSVSFERVKKDVAPPGP